MSPQTQRTMGDLVMKGIFSDKRAARRAGAPPRRRPDTLTELRWHQPLPATGDAARAVSAAICEKARSAARRRQCARSQRR